MKLTVLIPVYNTKSQHLLEAIDSVYNQSHNGHDIILIDDASNSSDTLNALGILNSDKFTQLHLRVNKGTSSALNLGHSWVKTEYVAIMGSDDISHPDRFKKQIEYLKKHPKTDVLGTNLFAYYNDDIRRTPAFTTAHKEIPVGLHGDKNWLVNHGTVIYRQSAVMAVGGYNEKVKRGQDVDLWKRMKANGAIFRNVTDVLYAWRRFKQN